MERSERIRDLGTRLTFVLCRNLIHWQRYKRAVDATWTVGPATTIEQSYPLGPSVPMMMRHLAWQKLDSKEGEKVA